MTTDIWKGLLIGIGVGASMMYVLDPRRRNRLASQARDQVFSAAKEAREAVSARAENLSNRARGAVAEASAMMQGEPVDDRVLVERVRSHMGRIVSNPSAIEVTARDGRVSLRGTIHSSEVEQLISEVGWLRGVKDVENQLDVHDQAGDTPSLQTRTV
jgi:osmotically-inducible protein OsmY